MAMDGVRLLVHDLPDAAAGTAVKTETSPANEVNTTAATAQPEVVGCIDIRIRQTMDHVVKDNITVWRLDVANLCPFRGGLQCRPANIILHSPDFVTYSWPPMLGSIQKLYGNEFLVHKGHAIFPETRVFGYYTNISPVEPFSFVVVSFTTGCEGV